MKTHKKNTQPMFDLMIKMIISLIFSAALMGCGGGGGSGGDDGGSSSSAATNLAPVANAGEDGTMNAGDVVELKAGGTDSDGTVAEYNWSQLSGPNVPLTVVNLSAAHFTFVAPPTGTEDSITMEFRLRVTDNDGATGTDTVIFTVNRVNQSPVVDAGSDKHAEGLSAVNLSGTASDNDGSIASYLWVQTDGAAVELNNADSVSANFTAPSTNSDITLEFSLTVTDNNGASVSDVVAVVITPENAPLISLTFPPETGVYSANRISAFGMAETKNGATITAINVSAGGDSVAATFEPDGSWRADNVPVPMDVDSFTLVAEITDSESLTQEVSTTLLTIPQDVGGGDAWDEAKAVVAVPDSDIVYVLTSGTFVSDAKIVPVNIKTGHRGMSITDFTNAEQGPQNTVLQDMLYDHENQRLLLTNNPDSETVQPQIIAIDITTGVRSIISNPETGDGVDFINPIGLEWGPDNRLLVADNLLNAIISVDVESGNREIIADENTAGLGVDAPLFVSWDQSRDRLLVTPNIIINHYFLGLDDWLTGPLGFVLSSNNANPGPEVAAIVQGASMDADNDRLLILSGDDDLIALDLETGNRSLLVEDVTGVSARTDLRKNMDYDSVRKLLYVVDTGPFTEGLYVVDPEGGSSVLLSQ